MLLPIILTAVFIYFLQEIRYRVFKPVAKEQRPLDASAWRDFIEANIASCVTPEHCFHTYEMIKLFSVKFKGQVPAYLFQEWIENLSNRVDKKYKSIKANDDLSELTIEQLVN